MLLRETCFYHNLEAASWTLFSDDQWVCTWAASMVARKKIVFLPKFSGHVKSFRIWWWWSKYWTKWLESMLTLQLLVHPIFGHYELFIMGSTVCVQVLIIIRVIIFPLCAIFLSLSLPIIKNRVFSSSHIFLLCAFGYYIQLWWDYRRKCYGPCVRNQCSTTIYGNGAREQIRNIVSV